MSLRAVFLDWDGTLCAGRFWQQWKTQRPEAYRKIQEEFFAGNPDFLRRWMRGNETAESAAAVIAGITGIDEGSVLSALEESCRGLAFVSPRTPALIRALQEKGIAP